jgi:AhpD family alkylhydroperoxidase
MAVVNLKEFADASEKTRALYDAVQQKYGVVPNFIKAMGDNPAFLEAILQMHAAVFDGGAIPPKYKHLIALAVSMTNGCNYCTSSFTAHSQAMDASEQELAETRAIVALLSAYNKYLSAAGIPCDITPR